MIQCVCRFLLLLPLLILFSGCGSSEPELHVFIWTDYIKPELIERFEALHHCRVTVDTYDSNESMYAKIKLGATGYDVIFPSNYFVDIMVEQGMLKVLDPKLLPNLQNIDQEYARHISPKILNYSIPYMVSISGIAYRNDKVDKFEPSWGIFGNSKYKGRMTMLDDPRETFATVLRYLGYSANTTNPQELHKAADTLSLWAKNLAKFEGQQYKAGIASAEYLVVHGYNGDLLQVMQENSNISFVYPEEGTSSVIDLVAIPSTSQNQELAHAFINFLLDPDIAVENMEATFFFSPNVAAYSKLPKEMRENPVFFPPEKVVKKFELIRYLGEDGQMYDREWDRVKGGH